MRPSLSGHGYGVSYDNKRCNKKFGARIFYRGRLELGGYRTAFEAQLAYDQAVRLLGLEGHYRTNHSPDEYRFWSLRVAEAVALHLQYLEELDAAGGGSDDEEGAGDDQDGPGGDAAALGDALHDADDTADEDAGAAVMDHVEADADAPAAADALSPADHSMELDQPDLIAGAVPAAAAAATAAADAAGPEGPGGLLADLMQAGPQGAPAAAGAAAPPAAGHHQPAAAAVQQQQQPPAAQQQQQQPHAAQQQQQPPAAFAAQQPAHLADIPYHPPVIVFVPQAAMGQDAPQAPQLPAPLAAADILRCVDTTVGHLTQLYVCLTAQPLQHAGHAALLWMSAVRAQCTAQLSSNNAVPPAVYCAVMRMCTAVVAAAAEAPSDAVFGPFSCNFLLVVLELLSQKLLSLRDLCLGVHPAHHLSVEAMQAWRAGLGAQPYSRAGQAVAAVLSFL